MRQSPTPLVLIAPRHKGFCVQPKVSIIIPTYNAQEYIARCLESCINQSLREIEILIVDDCGSDDSIEIAKNYAMSDSRIRILHNPRNLGTFHARQTGILEAKAEFCMFADPDDYLALNACEIAYRTITTHKTDMAHFCIAYKPKGYRIKPLVHKGRLEGDAMRYFLSAGNNLQSLCDKIYHKSVLLRTLKALEILSPPLKLHEDGLLVFVASLESHSYFGTKDCIYYYCHNPNSITKSKTTQVVATKQSQSDKLLDLLRHLEAKYPKHTALLHIYQRKIASALMMESRDFDIFIVYESMLIAHKHNLHKNYDIPPYLKAMLLSLHYGFRWQSVVRIIVFICSFGKLRL